MKNEEIYKEIDSKLKRGAKGLVAYAKTRRGKNGKKYKYYAQFIFMEYKDRTAESIRGEFTKAGVQFPPSIGNIWNIKAKIMDNIETKKPLEDGERECWVEGCKRKIAPGNHAYCKYHHDKNKRRSDEVETSSFNARSAGSY